MQLFFQRKRFFAEGFIHLCNREGNEGRGADRDRERSVSRIMRYVPLRERGPRTECSLCGRDIEWGQRFYRVNGQDICVDCLADYAGYLLADCLCGEEAEELW